MGPDIKQEDTKLSWRSVRGYVSAITDLYQQQRVRGMNTHTSPRESQIKEYIKSLQRADMERQRAQFADKGRDTLLDGYSEAEVTEVCHQLWSHGAISASTPNSTECHLRTLIDFLLGHYMLTRGGNRRSAEISDLFTFEFVGEGPTPCFPLIWTTRAGKQNQHGRLETSAALRNKDLLVCPIGALAFYLLYRWDLTDEPFPHLGDRKDWYNIKLLKSTWRASAAVPITAASEVISVGGTSSVPPPPAAAAGDRNAELAYNTQYDWASKAFEYAGITAKKVTHAPRGSGAQMAELLGVSEDQIRRAGRWNTDQMTGCYLNCLPRKFMRRMGGYPSQMGGFELARADIKPPDCLLSMIWPELSQWQGRFGPRQDQIDDLAAKGFVDLLSYLREVTLQDSVALRRRYPSHPLWSHRVFAHAAYEAFAQQVTAKSENILPSPAIQFYSSIPMLLDYLKAVDSRAVLKQNGQAIGELQEAVRAIAISQRLQTEYLKSLTSGQVTLRFEAEPCPPRRDLGGRGIQEPPTPGYSAYVSARASMAPSPPPPELNTMGSLRDAARDTAHSLQLPPPRHTMSRATRTIEALWHEWTVGLPNQPSIQYLDTRWGARWRSGRRSELQWYSLRSQVINEIRETARRQQITEEQAMREIQLWQGHLKLSLDRFCKYLMRRRREREVGVSRSYSIDRI